MRVALIPMLIAALVVSACAVLPNGDGRTVTVLAAASLAEPFEELHQRFVRDHPEVEVKLNFAGSSSLAQQIREGAPVDVFASADRQNMDKVAEQDLLAGEPEVFARNELTIVTPPGNPERVRNIADLSGTDRTVVVCAPEVPCGAATKRVEERAGVSLDPASEEENVKEVLTKVELGEADAGLTYVSDAVSSERVERVDLAEAESARNDYPIATLAEAPQPELAREFRDLVLSETGQDMMRKVGFDTP